MEPNTNQSNTPKVSALDFFVNFGVFITLYTLVANFLAFCFSVINSVLVDTQDYYNYYDPYGSSMRMSLSILIVTTPLLIFLLRLVHKSIEADSTKKDIWVRRWGLYLTLFAASAMIIVDLIVFINTYLSGEIAQRFIWKVVVTLLVGAAIFWYTRADLKNRFSENRKLAVGVAWTFAIIIAGSIALGLSLLGSPSTMRDLRDDNQREMDLSTINSQIISYYQSKGGVLPANLDDMSKGDPYAYRIPTDPKTKTAYKYEIVDAGKPYVQGTVVNQEDFPAYKLCSNFALDGEADKRLQGVGGSGRVISPSLPVYDSYYGGENRFDKHPAGEHCFEISIDPQRYPPYNPVKPQY